MIGGEPALPYRLANFCISSALLIRAFFFVCSLVNFYDLETSIHLLISADHESA